MISKKTAFLASFLLTGCIAFAGGHGAHWGYTGHEGPEHWGELDEKYLMCGMGMNQSPINIVSSLDADLEPIRFDYKSKPTEILNNGHTVQVNVAPGSTISLEGQVYELKQYHFHTPSENHINDKAYPLEVHFVHANKAGNLAVVGVMFDAGDENSQLAKLWKDMPMKAGDRHDLSASAADIVALLPKGLQYYRFDGSLTTPPCTEGVKWMVLADALTISKEQVEKFAHAVHGANNRPIQPINARVIVK